MPASSDEREPTPEVRYERLRPAEMSDAIGRLPLAYVPLGPMEYHGDHLPFGVDAFTSHAVCVRAARRAGGVVLPPSYVACGCLDLPFTLDYDHGLVEAWARATLAQLARRGLRAAVVLSGHCPLDLLHLLKRVCREAEAAHPGFSAQASSPLELNAARLDAPETDEPVAIDHAARVETSWMLALRPDLVALDRLADDPEAAHVGVYGPNPRFTASAAFGEEQVAAGSELLAARARDLVAGTRGDALDDLRAFVRWSWPEVPLLAGRAEAGSACLLLTNPGRASRYVSALRVEVDGVEADPAGTWLVNRSAGETGVEVAAAALDAEHGFYVRRGQTAEIRLGGIPAGAGRRRVRIELGLGGVTTLELDEEVEFTDERVASEGARV
ncbi:MAG TPA: creatininase family protein [Solirubrobacteraceae bacterium]|nr:creatininase family protein [Solirubrobacteraceae bacterium]